jgi:hypothetical protein
MMAEMNDERRPDFLERHYTVAELSKAWHVSARVVREWFTNEPGIVKYGAGKLRKNCKRIHVSIRIPESVARRVYNERMKIR